MNFSFSPMVKKQQVFIKSGLALLLGFLCYYFFIDTKGIESLEPHFSIASEDLVELYSDNEKKADNLYTNKIVEVYGTVKEISYLNDRKTIILAGNSESSNIICDLNENQLNKLNQLKNNQTVYIKGICKGYLKDVILLDCYIDTLKNNE